MQADDVLAILSREPFVPLTLVKTDGKSLDIPFKHVLVPRKSYVLVFKGVESPTSRFAKDGYESVNYEAIERLEPRRPTRRGGGKGGTNGRNGGGRKRRK
jgi:hypothetical protein